MHITHRHPDFYDADERSTTLIGIHHSTLNVLRSHGGTARYQHLPPPTCLGARSAI